MPHKAMTIRFFHIELAQAIVTAITRGVSLSIGTLAYGTLLTSPSWAQVIPTPDNSLGTESSVVNPGISVRGDLATFINGGATRGTNLFHSFTDFNVGEGQRVYFANPAAIDNILSRVTGGSVSNIDGLLGVNGDANLFLLNPNGVILGPDARLDINGSFSVSTAGSFAFTDGSEFRAIPQVGELFSASVPLGVQFNHPRNAPQGNITSTGILETGQDLTLAGDNLYLEGQLLTGGDLTLLAEDTVTIRDTATDAFIANAGGNLTVQGNQGVDISTLQHLEQTPFVSGGNLRLISDGVISGDAHYWSGGNFRVETLNGELGSLMSPVDPIIRTLGDVEILAYMGTSLHILAGGSVKIGTAIIEAPDARALGTDFLQETVTLSDGKTKVEIHGGAQPTLDIRAGVNPEFLGNPPLITGLNNNSLDRLFRLNTQSKPSSANIEIGDAVINAPNGMVLLTNQYQPNLILSGSILVTGEGEFGDGINASFQVSVDEEGSISVNEGGTVYLDSRDDVKVTNSSIETSGFGDVGDIIVNADETVVFGGSKKPASINSSLQFGDGKAGNIQITTGALELLNGASLTTNTFGMGNAGNIVINANRVSLAGNDVNGTGSSIQNGVGLEVLQNGDVNFGVGNGGSLEIITGTLELLDGAQLRSNTFGRGDSAHITINADKVSLAGSDGNGGESSIQNAVAPTAEGNGGSLKITTGLLELLDGTRIFSSTLGMGNAADITINANKVSLAGNNNSGTGSSIQSGVGLEVLQDGDVNFSVGNGGGLKITARTLELLDGAQIKVETFGIGNSGDIIINADKVSLAGSNGNNGEVSAILSGVGEVAEGNGGSLKIITGTLELLGGAQIDSGTFGMGAAGDVDIEARNRISLQGAEQLLGQTSGISTTTFSSNGEGADIRIVAPLIIIRDGAFLLTSTLSAQPSGDITLSVERLEILDGGQVLASSQSNGPAGNIRISATDSIILAGRDPNFNNRLARFTEGNSEEINILKGIFFAESTLSVRSLRSGDTGNISIGSEDVPVVAIVLKDGSQILAEANDESKVAGGNIVINADFLIAIPNENNDIIANAVGGNGGQIEINANSIFGLIERSGLTTAELRTRSTSDLSASSELGVQGDIVLNTLDVDPSQGLTELPADLSDRTNQITAGCGISNNDSQSEFVITGRGGLPPSPSDPATSNQINTPWVTYTDDTITTPETESTAPLVEAQQITLDANGNAYFVAHGLPVTTACAATAISQH